MYIALSVKTIGDQVGPHDTGVLMDPRCFLEQHNNQAAVMVQMQKELIELKSGQNIIVHNQEMILKNQKNILQNQAMIMRKITSVSTELNTEEDDVGVIGTFHLEGQEVLLTPNAKFSTFFLHNKTYSPTEIFSTWFTYEIPKKYEFELKSNDYKDKNENDRRAIRNRFAKIQSVVGCMLLYHDKYPDRKPLQIQDLMEWTSQLVNGIAECLIKMRNCLNISNETEITKNTIIKYFDNGTFDKGLSLPHNT